MMTRDSHRMRLAILAAIPAALATAGARPADAGCTKDVECKGVRICESGRCVYPPPDVEAQGPAEAASPGAAPPSAAPAPGSPPSLVPPAGAPAVATPPTGTIAEPSVSASSATDVAAFPGRAAPGPCRVAARAASAERLQRPPQVEIGAFGFGIHDGKSGALGGGVQAGIQLSRWLAIGVWLEGSGQRDAMLGGEAFYHLYDLGLGLTAGTAVGPVFAEASVLPELTLLAVKGRNLTAEKSTTPGGVAVAARLRLGLLLGSWRPFIFAANSFPFGAKRFTVHDPHVYDGSTTLPRANVSLGLGLGYCFGGPRSDETIVRRPSPGFGE